jgi:hypothetical protein
MSKRVTDTVVGILIIVMMMCMMCACSYVESHYTRKDCVVVQTEGQLVHVEDGQGHVWCYEVEDDAPSVGSTVDLHMYTNNTDSYIYDDEVVKVVVH